MDVVADIFEEAANILRIVKKLRDAQPVSHVGTELQVIKASDFAERVLSPRGEPAADTDAASAYEAALRWWACRSASQMDYEQWCAMLQHAADVVPDFRNVVGFFERVFADLELRDGWRVTP